jgi:putative ABC transport system permease protein
MKFFGLLFANFRRRKLRAALTFLSILVAFMLFGFLCAVKQALVGGVQMAGADRLVVREKISIINLLPVSYKARMERVPGVALAVHQTWFGGVYQDPKKFFMQCPVEPEDYLAMFPEFLLPPEQKEAWLKSRTACIVGRRTANRFGWKIGDRIPIQSAIWGKKDGSHAWEFDVAGIFDGKNKNTDTTAMFFHYDYFDETRQWGTGQVGWYTIRVREPARAAEIARLVDQEFENSSNETKTEPEGAFLQGWASQIGNVSLIVGSILAAVFFTILLVTGNTIAQSVRERTGELGVLKAIGFTNGHLMALVLSESCSLALAGGLAGLGLVWMITAKGDPTGGLLPMFFLPKNDILTGVLISLGLGLAAGAVPALGVMRLRVADALRKM